tara:strand:+ start:2479 stop:2679 length:201 start_codon:yes stop_codon:yes gene_type:complete
LETGFSVSGLPRTPTPYSNCVVGNVVGKIILCRRNGMSTCCSKSMKEKIKSRTYLNKEVFSTLGLN